MRCRANKAASNAWQTADGLKKRIALPFTVADRATEKGYATLVTTQGEVWDLTYGGYSPFKKRKTRLSQRLLPNCHAEQGAGKTASRAVQALASPHGHIDYINYTCVGGCVSVDGRVHVWNRTGTVPRRPNRWEVESSGTPIAGWTAEGAVVSSAVLPGLRAAALCAPYVGAITHDGSVWIAKFRLWKETVNGPIHATAFDEWKEVSLAWVC
jgi:hypothetical protein